MVAPAPPETELLTCPVCGGRLIEGEDDWDGVLIAVRFCEQCAYREEACPDCGSTIEEAETTIDGQATPALRCLDCPWQEPIPALEME